MSRGLGRLQRALFNLIGSSDKPMTFAEIRAHVLQVLGANDPDSKLRPSFERSLRRGLRRMTEDGTLMALGEGGPGDARRYCLDPLLVAITSDKEAFERAMNMVNADPGGNDACTKAMGAMARRRATG